MIFPISHNGNLGFCALTESHTFRENRIYGISGFSGALGGFGTPVFDPNGLGPTLWGLKDGLLYWFCWNGFDLNSSTLLAWKKYPPIGEAEGDDLKRSFKILKETGVPAVIVWAP